MNITIGLTFPGELKDEAIICYLCKNFNIELSILEASFSEYSGWAILGIKGNDEEIKKSFAYLSSKGINIQRIEPMK
jgi:ABC-type methionine transport system ATPase subunit